MSYTYLLTIGVILISTKVLGIFTGKLHMPQVVGALIAGLLLGPAGFGLIHSNEFLIMLAELGVIVIMFSAGMETSISDLKHSGKSGLIVAFFGVSVPLIGGAALMMAFNPTGNMLENIFMGVVLTATSVSITVEALKEMGKLSTKVGNTILAAALIDDILGLVCLTIVSSLGGEGESIGWVLLKIVLFFVFSGVIGFLYFKITKWYYAHKSSNLHRYPVIAFALCLFMAWSAEVIFGVADIIGAFAAGLMVSSTPKGNYIESKFSPLSYLLLTPIFFANIGLEIVLPKMDLQLIIFCVLLVIIGVLSKLIGCGIGAKFFCGFKTKQAVQIGLGMACRGEVALITANKGLAMGILPEEFFGPIVILVVCCAVFTPILLKLSFRGEKAYEGMQESILVDNYQINENLALITDRLLQDESKRQENIKNENKNK